MSREYTGNSKGMCINLEVQKRMLTVYPFDAPKLWSSAITHTRIIVEGRAVVDAEGKITFDSLTTPDARTLVCTPKMLVQSYSSNDHQFSTEHVIGVYQAY